MTTRKEILIALLLGAVGVLSRLPFLELGPFYTDSFHFLQGIVKTGVAHPPGYIGYITLARALGYIAGSPHRGMLALNLLSTFITAIALYALGRRISNDSTPASAALMTALFLFNPFTWYYGDVSLSFITEAMTAVITALFCWEVLRGKKWATYASAAALALGASVRQTLLVFMLPLWIAVHLPVLWQGIASNRDNSIPAPGSQRSLKLILSGILLMVPLVAVWMIPTIHRYESLGGYSKQFERQMAEAVWINSIFIKGLGGAIKNTAKLEFAVAWGMNASILLLLFKPARKYLKELWATERNVILFLAIWILPSILFYTIIFMGPPGYIFVFLPALYLPLAGAIKETAWKWAVVAMVISGLLFILPRPLSNDARRSRLINVFALKYNANGIMQKDSRNLEHLDSYLPRDYGDTSKWHKQ